MSPVIPYVLIVDDDDALLEMVTFALKGYDFDLSTMPATSELFAFLNNSEQLPAVILMDVYWAGNDGRTVCRQLKTSEEFRQIPVILYSAGNISDDSIRHSLADQFIPKPFDITKLAKAIQKFIDQSS